MTPPDDDPALRALVERVRAAQADGSALEIAGHGSKAFYGGPRHGEALYTTGLTGISSYEPTELVVSARAGTPIAELEAALAEQGQCLPFEPPRFRIGSVAKGTVGGLVAAGLSGPSRASVGAVRDHVLGATLLNGRAEVLSFGGQVMKNVAGYDVSRLLCGSMGVLGIVLEVSLKVLPVQPATATLRFELDEAAALAQLNAWGGQPLPISASAWWSGMLLLRLRGARAAVNAAVDTLLTKHRGEGVDDGMATPFWDGLRDHEDEFFIKARTAVESNTGAALWRLSVPQTAAPVSLPGEQLIEWGGAQRWWCTAASAATVREAAQRAGGHATLFRGGDKAAGVFTPLSAPLTRIQRELKREFDPAGVFNRGRLYPDL
ncbi:glycolate oxidase subunit GlcE [Methylibium sp. Root1272]|uniref:glycolate oxidase subunit GlcE n=1 Tax=Methylibium sp. Root1272 TaxID=1736441 RepID=UPI0006F3AA46|nr:glycolate oxidase subunit GlcE [Methylibium sp. Root1272]KQW68510.1 glycolate oxidase [Methylibium sp. Root1272]